jgi:hypothetical protein
MGRKKKDGEGRWIGKKKNAIFSTEITKPLTSNLTRQYSCNTTDFLTLRGLDPTGENTKISTVVLLGPREYISPE